MDSNLLKRGIQKLPRIAFAAEMPGMNYLSLDKTKEAARETLDRHDAQVEKRGAETMENSRLSTLVRLDDVKELVDQLMAGVSVEDLQFQPAIEPE